MIKLSSNKAEIETYRMEEPTCALRWSSQGVLQQAFRIEQIKEGQVVGVGMEWRDVPREGA